MHKLLYPILGFTTLIFYQTGNAGEDYLCPKSAIFSEYATCANPKLQNLAVQMTNSYQLAMHISRDPFETRRVQSEWLKFRNACSDDACVQFAYEDRLPELAAIIFGRTTTLPDPQAGKLQDEVEIDNKQVDKPIETISPAAGNLNLIGLWACSNIDNRGDNFRKFTLDGQYKFWRQKQSGDLTHRIRINGTYKLIASESLLMITFWEPVNPEIKLTSDSRVVMPSSRELIIYYEGEMSLCDLSND